MPWLDHAPHYARPTPPPAASRFAVPLLAWAAVRTLAATQADPGASAETAFLALTVAGVLAAIAALSPRVGELGVTAVVAVTAVWMLGHGPHRGAALALLLAGALAIAAARRFIDLDGRLPPELTIPAAFGFQVLTRSDLLLPPWLDARTLVSVFALPLAAALATSALAARLGPRRALFAAAVAGLLAPGWNVTSTLALLTLAAGALAGSEEVPRGPRILACAAILAAAVLKFPIGLLFAFAGLALALGPRLAWALPAVASTGALAMPAARGWTSALEVFISGLLLVPLLPLAGRQGLRWALTGLVVALAGARLGLEADALAGGLALAALALPRRGTGLALQGMWLGVLGGLTTLLVAYPFARERPRLDALGLLGLEGNAVGLAAVVVIALLLVFLLPRIPARCPPRAFARFGAGLAIFIALAAALPRGGAVLLENRVVMISQDRAEWSRELTAELDLGEVTIDSNLTRSSSLAPGTVVATVELFGADGRVSAAWALRAGEETAEWAAGRADIVFRPGFEAPPPWLSFVAPDGRFFGHRYRARWAAPEPFAVAGLRIRRHPDLPAEVGISIYRVELRP